MKRIIALLLLGLSSCTYSQSNKSVHIFIPINYTGWVNLIFNDSNSINKPITFDNGYVYVITKDPQFYRLRTDKFPSGKYEMHYYYYSQDTMIQLSWLGYPKKNILFEQTIGSKSRNSFRSSLYTFSFYVSKEPLNQNEITLDMLPKNKIIE